MIMVHSMQQNEVIYLNPNMIEKIRVTPDTVLFMNTGQRVLVQESPDEIIERIVAFWQKVYRMRFDPTAYDYVETTMQ